MRVFIRSNDKLGALALVYRNRVLNEKPGFRGASHLCEHLKMRWIFDVNDEYDKYGLDYNAYTGARQVVFYLTGLNRYLRRFADDFLFNVMNYVPTEEEFERERRVVIAEYGEALTSMPGVYGANFLRRNYGFCGALGYREDLENLTYESFLDFRRRLFSKPDCLVEIGAAERAYPVSFGRRLKGAFPRSSAPLKLENYGDAGGKDIMHLHAAFDSAQYPYGCFASILLGGLGPLFKVLRQENSLTYSVSANAVKYGDDFAAFDVIAMVDEANLVRAKELAFDVLRAPEKFITRRRFADTLFSCRVDAELSNMSRARNLWRYLTPEREQVAYLVVHKLLEYEPMMDFIRNLKFSFFSRGDCC